MFTEDTGSDALLVKCMSSLTERFLVPLNRYFATLLPADAQVSYTLGEFQISDPIIDRSNAMSTPRKTLAFNQANFLQSLRTHGTVSILPNDSKMIDANK